MKGQRAIGDRMTWTALGAIALLVALGLVAQRNADWYSGREHYESQVVWFLVGGVAFVVAAVVDLRLVERGSYLFYGLWVLLLVATALAGTEVNNSQRWLRFGGFNLQASEAVKLGLILAMARHFHGQRQRVPGEGPPQHEGPYTLRQLWRVGLLAGVPTLLVLLQPDLGTALVLVFVAAALALREGVTRRGVAALAVVFLVGVPVAWKYEGIQTYQKERVYGWIDNAWLKLDAEAGAIMDKRSLQSEQAIWAIGSGQFWGQGSRAGAQSRLKHLPEMHTDMIIATFAEEQGFIGCTFLLLLYWVVVIWCVRTAHDARDRFCSLLALGVASMIGWQVFVNIAMVAGLLPVVGLPLPIMSYGGSSTLTTMASLGLVLNVALRRGRL